MKASLVEINTIPTQHSRIFCLLLILSLISVSSVAQQDIYDDMVTCMDWGIEFLMAEQITETIEGQKYKGEWPSQMCLQRAFPMMGKSRCLDDSNCFSVASIHNALAEIYLAYPEYEAIPSALDPAFEQIISYRNGDGFNFWKLLPPTRNLKRGVVPDPQPWGRRPTNFDLEPIYVCNAANVVEDADDTALSYIAMALRKKVLKNYPISEKYHFNTDSLAIILDGYLDKDRNNRHWFNIYSGNDHDTGAYLTWLGKEYQFKNWNYFFDTFHDIFFLAPISECYPHPYKPYIPYGSNNIDAVVNSNVLTALAMNDIEHAEGRPGAIKYIAKKSKKRKYRRVGSYYPNSYHFPYAMSNAYAKGTKGMEESCKKICKNLLRKQAKNGSWKSKRKLNKRDRVMSTAYALNALLNMGKIEERKTKDAIENAITYLLEYVQYDDNGYIYWEGGVFFSGGTVVRNNLIWKSHSFTTAVILSAFSKYRSYLETTYGFKPSSNSH